MSATVAPPIAPSVAAVPRLADGDRLSREEFHRRYHAMPPGVKWELIEGVVFMASPASIDGHGEQHLALQGHLALYRFKTPGVRAADNGSVMIDRVNELQPDTVVWIDERSGGQARIGPRKYMDGAPEMAVEISFSSARRDLGPKKIVYARNGVQEYLVWRVKDRALDWFRLRGGDYELLPVGADGVVRSEVFPGLRLHPAALIAEDFAAALAATEAGFDTPEHRAFVARLAAVPPASR